MYHGEHWCIILALYSIQAKTGRCNDPVKYHSGILAQIQTTKWTLSDRSRIYLNGIDRTVGGRQQQRWSLFRPKPLIRRCPHTYRPAIAPLPGIVIVWVPAVHPDPEVPVITAREQRARLKNISRFPPWVIPGTGLMCLTSNDVSFFFQSAQQEKENRLISDLVMVIKLWSPSHQEGLYFAN